MIFKEYQHIEKLGSLDVEGIEIGTCYIFPKLDGTNASIWLDDNKNIQTGSRTRWLSEGQNDNAGFREAVKNDIQFDGIKSCLKENPNLRFFGEWLVSHTLKTYRQDAWRKFYVFDVIEENGENWRYLEYNEYKLLCEKYNINYIPCIAEIKNPQLDDIIRVSQSNNYLIEDGKGIGEGLTIKNYEFVNKFGRKTWAKFVTSEFKENHYKEMGHPKGENKLLEEEIIEKFCTEALIDKVYAKIVNDSNGWSSKFIPRLLETVYHDLIIEETYNIIKKFNCPKIDFKILRNFMILKIKTIKKELF